RGVPTEEVLPTGQARGLKARGMRAADPPVHYLVGTPKCRLTRLEKHLIAQPWQQARPGVQVKLLAQEGELYVLAQSRDRVAKERAMRRRQLKRLWARLKQLSTMPLSREDLLMKLGAARAKAPAAWRLVNVVVAKDAPAFTYRLDRVKLRRVRRREGRYLLRSNLSGHDPAQHRAQNAAAPARPHAAAPATPAHHRSRPQKRPQADRNVVETFSAPPLIRLAFFLQNRPS